MRKTLLLIIVCIIGLSCSGCSSNDSYKEDLAGKKFYGVHSYNSQFFDCEEHVVISFIDNSSFKMESYRVEEPSMGLEGYEEIEEREYKITGFGEKKTLEYEKYPSDTVFTAEPFKLMKIDGEIEIWTDNYNSKEGITLHQEDIEDVHEFLLKKANKSSSSTSTNSKSSGCGFKYSDGSTCGAPIGEHGSLCDTHFNQLDSTYKSYTE